MVGEGVCRTPGREAERRPRTEEGEVSADFVVSRCRDLRQRYLKQTSPAASTLRTTFRPPTVASLRRLRLAAMRSFARRSDIGQTVRAETMEICRQGSGA